MSGRRPSDKFIEERRHAVLALWERGLTRKQILALLPNTKFGETSMRVLDHDIMRIKEGLVEGARDLFGDLQVVVGRHINKTLELRQKAWDAEDFRLVREIDKDLLKLCGINLDRIDVNLLQPDRPVAGGQVEPFIETVNRIREQKGLPAVSDDEI